MSPTSWIHGSSVFLVVRGLVHCWGAYAGGFAGKEFVERVGSLHEATLQNSGCTRRQWLRGVASRSGFAEWLPGHVLS